MSYIPIGVTLQKLQALSVTSTDSSLILPADALIQQILIKNNTGNAITGGLKIGTTAGATDVVVALAVGASVLLTIPAATILKNVFSTSATQTLYIDAVVAWNSASVDITVVYGQL